MNDMADAGAHVPETSVQAQRDHWKAQAAEAWQNVAELREGLSTLLKEFIGERDSLYGMTTNSEGQYDNDDDRGAVEEMDAVIAAAQRLLVKTSKS